MTSAAAVRGREITNERKTALPVGLGRTANGSPISTSDSRGRHYKLLRPLVECEWCSAKFKPKATGNIARVCSPTCGDKRRLAHGALTERRICLQCHCYFYAPPDSIFDCCLVHGQQERIETVVIQPERLVFAVTCMPCGRTKWVVATMAEARLWRPMRCVVCGGRARVDVESAA